MRNRIWATIAAFAVLSASAVAAATPARDAFTGTISAANGAYKGGNGKLSIAIGTVAPGPSVRRATFKLAGGRCHGRARCIRLRGTFHGTITVAPGQVADAGTQFTISGSGKVKPLGHVEVSGTARGTGFIMSAHESLSLTLVGASGTVTVTAQSGLVPGFTSP